MILTVSFLDNSWLWCEAKVQFTIFVQFLLNLNNSCNLHDIHSFMIMFNNLVEKKNVVYFFACEPLEQSFCKNLQSRI